MSVETSTELQERLRAAYPRAPLTMNPGQAQALAALLSAGELRGTVLPPVEPPRAVALLPLDKGEESDAYADSNAVHTLGVLSEDGRAFEIVRAGICWPVEADGRA